MWLCIAVVFAAYLFTPVWWSEIGPDAKDLYAAGVLSAAGGDPYQIAQQGAEEDRLYNPPGTITRYREIPYGYPPVVTAALSLGTHVSEPAFYVVSLGLLLGTGLVGFEFCLSILKWRGRWLARAFFLASAPMALDLFIGNPSALLLLFCGAGAWLLVSGRPVLGGLVLSGMALKPQVGLPIAVAVIATAPWAAAASNRLRLWAILAATVGMVAGVAGLAALGAALEGPASLGRWSVAAREYGNALGPGAPGSAFAQTGLAGLPALLMGRFSAPLAAVITAVVVAPAIGFALWRLRDRIDTPSFGPMAVGIAVALALSPYLHLNDLVLAALPLLLIASQRLNPMRRGTLFVWAVGPYLLLVVLTILSPPGVAGFGQVGIGVVLTGLLLLSAVQAVVAPPPPGNA